MGTIYGGWQRLGKVISVEQANRISKIASWWNPHRQESRHDQTIVWGAARLNSTSDLNQEEIVSHSTGVTLVCDARLDNQSELLQLLKRPAAQASNTELILQMYLKYGTSCFKHLIGAFSIAIWDPNKQQCIIARDQMGVKPLSYFCSKDIFAFGTQRKSILAWEGVDRSPDWRYLLQSMSSLGYARGSTAHQQIHFLSPGHILIVGKESIRLEKYWKLDLDKRTLHKSEGDYIEEFRHHFDGAVSCRMQGSEHVGVHLSGGLDSSGITAAAYRLRESVGVDLTALSYGVDRNYEGDQEKVEENLRAYDLLDFLRMHDSHVNVDQPIDRTFQEVVQHEALCCDGISQSNNVNTEYEIQAAAADRGIGVVLSGFPGDELVTSFCRPFYLDYFESGAYWQFFTKKMKSRHTWKHRARAFTAAVAGRLLPAQSETVAKLYAKWRYDKGKYKGASPLIDPTYFEERNLSDVLDPIHLPQAHQTIPSSLRAYQRNHVCRPHGHRRMESEQLAGLPWHVEYRYPMTDIRLLQYVISLPLEMKISPDMSRRIFRLGMEGYLPDAIRLRDVKTSGSLKPMKRNIDFHQADESKHILWRDIKESGRAPFLNVAMVDKWIESKRSPYAIYPWMILGQLGFSEQIVY